MNTTRVAETAEQQQAGEVAGTLPTERQTAFDPPEELTDWEGRSTVRRLDYRDGHQGWLATGYATTRAILADPRFSARSDLAHSPLTEQTDQPLPPGFFIRMDAPEHTHYRKLLTGQFTVRRMQQLEPRIAAIVAERLEQLESTGGPVDLVQSYALPIPSLVICELLGVPYEDRESFQHHSSRMLSMNLSPEERNDSLKALMGYLHEIVQIKRANPTDDLIGKLAASDELDDDELAGIAVLLLIAGHETTANMIALGTFALLSNPAQLEKLRADPAVVDATIEELMRYLSVVTVIVRTALEDVEIEGQAIKAGESVTLALGAANRDPGRFEANDRLDLDQSARGHLAFGHGMHQCLGQQLARIEMRIAIPELVKRFPGLHLAVDPAEVPMRSDMFVYGVHQLPVTW